MRLKSLCLLPLGFFSAAALAESLVPEAAAKRLLKDSAPMSAPAGPVPAADSAEQSVEKAKNLQESMERPPTALKQPAIHSPAAIGIPEPAAAMPDAAKKAEKVKSSKRHGKNPSKTEKSAPGKAAAEAPNAFP